MKLSASKIALLVLTILLCFVLYLIISIKNDPFQDVNITNPNHENFSLYKLIHVDGVDNLYENFPYEIYAQKVNLDKFEQIDQHIVELDSITKSPFLAQSILSVALTTKLSLFQSSDFDTLQSIINWADKFHVHGVKHVKYLSFYESVKSYWYNEVSSKLAEISKENSDVKYKFKYRYLLQRCRENGFDVSAKVSNSEKVVINIIEMKWSYLMHRFWFGTSVFLKFIGVLGIIINVTLIVFGIKYIKSTYFK